MQVRLRAMLTATMLLVADGAGAKPVRGALPAWQPGIAGDLAFETSAFLQGTAYFHPGQAADQLAPDGAYGPLNRAWDQGQADHWLIEEQRYAVDAVIAGVGHHRQDLVERGERIFDWGFAHENPDGGFTCPDRFHSASFFIEAAAHAALLLQASDMAAANAGWVAQATPRLHLAARWMLDPANARPGQQHDGPYTHRFYLDADALGETGLLTGDGALVAASRDYVRRGIARQDPSGFNPEKGGWDTSYHSVGLLFAATYYTLVADDVLRTRMRPMADRGLAWLAARIRPDGTVDQTGNTRTGFGQERGPQGNVKTMSYGSAYRAFYYWGMIERDPAKGATAALLHDGQQVENAQRKAAGG